MSLYLKIEDASALQFADGRTRVSSHETYLGWQAEQLANRGIARTWYSDERLHARVNHGRWIADCAACKSGMLTHPEWRLACCGECGAIYSRITFPVMASAIEHVLCRRPQRSTQNWFPTETVNDLLRENREHGVS